MGRDIDDMLADAREDYREERQELKDKWDRLEERRVEIEKEGDSAWDRFKDEIEDGWNNIKDSFDDLRRRLAR